MKAAKPLIFHFLLNVAIVAACVGIAFYTQNPLAILGLTFLQSMPVFPPEHMVQQSQDDDGEELGKIGFVTD